MVVSQVVRVINESCNGIHVMLEHPQVCSSFYGMLRHRVTVKVRSMCRCGDCVGGATNAKPEKEKGSEFWHSIE